MKIETPVSIRRKLNKEKEANKVVVSTRSKQILKDIKEVNAKVDTLINVVLRSVSETNKEMVEPMQYSRPSLGVTPRFLVDEARLEEITQAIENFILSSLPIPKEWTDEYNELAKRIGNRKK